MQYFWFVPLVSSPYALASPGTDNILERGVRYSLRQYMPPGCEVVDHQHRGQIEGAIDGNCRGSYRADGIAE
jgi:hypothetical protein